MKNLTLILILTFVISLNKGIGQNLFVNGDFENPVTLCPMPNALPTWPGPNSSVDRVEGWTYPTYHNGSADIFHVCAASVPVIANTWPNYPTSNFRGNEAPQSGDNYGGFIGYRNGISNAREYLVAELTTPLTAGVTYYLSFWTSLGDDGEYRLDEIQWSFTDTIPEAEYDNTKIHQAFDGGFSTHSYYQQHLKKYGDNPCVGCVADVSTVGKNGWTQINSTYTAVGGERYFTIGNFENDANSVITSAPSGSGSINSYYYVDNFVLTDQVETEYCDIEVDQADTTMCQGGSIDITATSGFSNYVWSTGDSTQSIEVNQTGLYVVEIEGYGGDQITNGGFEAGNSGFSTEYNPADPAGSWGPLTDPGQYGIFSSGPASHTNFVGTPHSGSNMFIANGDITANTEVWCQDITVEANTYYEFSAWVSSMVVENPAVLQFSIDGNLLGSPFNAPSSPNQWENFFTEWSSGSDTTIRICIVNLNIISSGDGNDFALDDIFFSPICRGSDSITVTMAESDTANFNIPTFCVENENEVIINGTTGGLFSFDVAPLDNAIIESISGIISQASEGTYQVKYVTGGQCKDSVVETVVVISSLFDNLFDDQEVCNIPFDVNIDVNGVANVHYEDIEYSNSISIEKSGFQLFEIYDTNGCVLLDSFEVSKTPIDYNSLDTFICDFPVEIGEEILGTSDYTWNTNDIFATLTIEEKGDYWVEIIDSNGCVRVDSFDINCPCQLKIPTAFTPGNDGVNDEWHIEGLDCYEDIQLLVYNRWGTVVFEGQNDWDGGDLPVASYYYVLKGIESDSGELLNMNGTVSIIK